MVHNVHTAMIAPVELQCCVSGPMAKQETWVQRGLSGLQAYVVKELLEMEPDLRQIVPCGQTLICYITDNEPYKRHGLFPPKNLNYQVVTHG